MGEVIAENIARKIFLARKSADLSQSKFAKLLNVSQNTISQWETNKREPDFRSLYEIAKLTGKPIAWFFENHDDTPTEKQTTPTHDNSAKIKKLEEDIGMMKELCNALLDKLNIQIDEAKKQTTALRRIELRLEEVEKKSSMLIALEAGEIKREELKDMGVKN